MNSQQVLTIGQQAFHVLLTVSAPILLVVLVVGMLVSIVQAATQINESTLSFVPKILAAAAVLAIVGPWMITMLVEYLQSVLCRNSEKMGLREENGTGCAFTVGFPTVPQWHALTPESATKDLSSESCVSAQSDINRQVGADCSLPST